jgi:nuclear factor of activated T-cells 5
MFYQACKVSGKNSTPCVEKKVDGTCVIELQLDPSKEMSATCDCVGILKERNVDVEHRFPDQLGNRSKKKSTRCRMIFRTTLTHDDGSQETLQVCSQPIVCSKSAELDKGNGALITLGVLQLNLRESPKSVKNL